MKPSRTRSLPTGPVALLTIACLSLFSTTFLQAQRLPSTVIPRHYALKLTPDLKAATFTGVETIDVTLKQPATAITLNAAEIAFQSVTVTAGGAQQVAQVSLDKARQQATLTFERELPAGRATLAIHYTGILNNELRGFYLSKGDHRNYAVTQFEPTDARRAFPSFDEPALKATFDISLIVDKGDTAISNTPIATDTPGPGQGKHTLRFLTTPRMSTYLVAFLVGDFQCTAGEQDGVKIRVCATPDKVALTSYALGVATYALHYYDTYFGIPYPLKKLDLIALPDFEAGAMENFGAITYRETDLLLDPATATVDAKKNVAIVVAHEMAHQWFGDLVTMQWWDNVWLNEGFATWMESKLVAAMHPEWNIDQDVASSLDSTLNIDARPTTRPIRARAETPAQINQMFDGIAYGKAGDVLLSVENYLGPETFRKGVQRYLRAHLYANATAQDFWNAETAVSHKPVDKIMDSLVSQPGVPLLIFGSPANGRVSVEQRRFFLTPSIQPDLSQKWTLPVCFKASAGQHCEVITPSTTSLAVPPSRLFFPNAGGKGYYRAAYTHSEYESLVAHVESELTPPERIMFIGDVWAQLRANKASAGDYLDLVTAIKSDPNATVVNSVLGGVIALYVRAAPSSEEKAGLAKWLRATFSPEYARLGPPAATDSPNRRQLRAQIFGILGYYGKDPAVLSDARRIAAAFLANPSSVDPTLAQMALSVAAQNGDEALFDKLQKTYETSTDPGIQMNALRLLAEFQNPALVQRALNFAVSDKVRNQDAAIQLAIALEDSETQGLAWQFIQTHWDKVKAQLTTEMGGILVGSTGAFCSMADRDSVEEFFSTHKVPASDVELKHAVERINGCVELRALQEPKLKSWLASQSGF
ncbi:MAG TPA: M1 family metallopeptidase [Terracidiphilus sp.]|nr:M1 family metallopeptidase [Terracidiphilus sp.]